MREGPQLSEPQATRPAAASTTRIERAVRALLVALAAVTGVGLMCDALRRSSSTYDEAMYLEVAAHWWRTGEQTRITRLGSPLSFWKLQQVPMLWTLDRLGYGARIDDPRQYEAQLLPMARITALWIWVAAFGLVAFWSHRLYGPRAMVLASWWFALSPNLLAHGPLVTMEVPILATTTGMAFFFWEFLRTGSRRAFVASAAVGGLAFSCKYTAVVLPPIFALLWLFRRWKDGDRKPARLALTVAAAMAGYLAIMGVADVIVTGGALLPISARTGEHPSFHGKLGPLLSRWVGRLIETPIPQDWVGFVRQATLQKDGAPSYLFGEIRDTGWRHYYLVTLAVKVPLAFWLIMALLALALARRIPSAGCDWMLPAAAALFLVIASLGSTRNMGIRYLLPIAPLAIVWVSGLAEATAWVRRAAWGGLATLAVTIAFIHPYELSYFNVLAGGPIGGRRILSDSNLDWSQGLKPLAELQRDRPELRDLTLFYFGDAEADRFGVEGRCYTVRAANPNDHLPTVFAPETPYVAVSASLQWGPWAPPGYFRALGDVEPVCYTADTTIAIYRTADILELRLREPKYATERVGSVTEARRSAEVSRE